jgi:hypothetical protein
LASRDVVLDVLLDGVVGHDSRPGQGDVLGDERQAAGVVEVALCEVPSPDSEEVTEGRAFIFEESAWSTDPACGR